MEILRNGVGNRTGRGLDTGSEQTVDAYTRVSGANRIAGIERNSAPYRSFTYDGAGNIVSETKQGITNTFAYNHAGRMRSVTLAGSQRGPYKYNGFGQLASRQLQRP